MAQHPGMHPGHSMGPGQHPGHMGGQMPGGGMVQQMHPGVSGPGGPQVSQAMVTGMPPGAGIPASGGPMPNAHAMSHLGPQQQFLQQQQQMNYQTNPQLMNQQHQALLARQRQQMMIQQHQQQQGGGPVTLPPGAQGMNPAHLAAMRQQGMGGVPMHIQQQLQAQAQAQQHQQPNNFQQQQQHQMQQLALQAQQNQQAAQRNSQMQAMHEMQNASSQPASSQTPQPQSQGTPQQQQQPPPQPQPQQQQPQPQPPTSGPQQHPPQSAPQQQSTPQQTPQNLQQTQQQQQQQQSQQQSQQQQGQNLQQPQPGNPQQQQQGLPEGQMKAQPQGPNAAMMMQQQRMQNPMRGASVLRLVQYGDQLSAFANREQSRDLGYWQSFVDKFFTKDGYLCQQLWDAQTGTQKTFQIAYPALPRYYWTMFCSGIRTIQMIMETARDHDLANNGHLVSSKSSFIYWFDNDCQLVTHGSLKAQLDSNSKIESLEFFTQKHAEYIPRSLLQSMADSPDMKQSPKMSKSQGKKAQQRQQQQSTPTVSLPRPTVSEWGVTTSVMQFLEMAETVSAMQTLFNFSHQNPNLSPAEALSALVQSFQMNSMGMQQAHLNPQMQQHPGQRTPGMNGPPQFASPAVGHLGLPGAQGSPHIGGPAHTPSPAQTHLAGPVAMAAQLSQQGTNASGSQGTSANTSPNVTNKRRRASAVKVEGDEGGGMEVNGGGGQKVKASPRVGGKRQKGTA